VSDHLRNPAVSRRGPVEPSLAIRALLLVALAASTAAADKADALFDKGKELLAQKKYAEACATFEQADALDPAIGAKLNVARCYEAWGKLAIALRWYRDAETLARDARDKRARKIRAVIQELDADVPRLTVHLPPGIDPDAAKVMLDGTPFTTFGIEQRVDPGRRVISYRAGGETRQKAVPLERGASSEITLDIPKADPVAAPPRPAPPDRDAPTTPAPSRWRPIAMIALGATGLVGLGTASYLTLDARSTYRDALRDHCMNASDMCDPEGVRITRAARGRANLATGITVASLAAIAGGVYLYVTRPERGRGDRRAEGAVQIVPTLGADCAGLAILGGF
jgi:tetratricopeptide (TPR) repeat protein